jgi:hypothetical protein
LLRGFPGGCYFLEIGEELSDLDAEMDAFFPFNAFSSVLLIQICDKFSRASAVDKLFESADLRRGPERSWIGF